MSLPDYLKVLVSGSQIFKLTAVNLNIAEFYDRTLVIFIKFSLDAMVRSEHTKLIT
jgi:hypothetical protein